MAAWPRARVCSVREGRSRRCGRTQGLAARVPAKPTNPFPAAAGLKMPSGLGLGLALLVCLA